jgi:hypothetical protein
MSSNETREKPTVSTVLTAAERDRLRALATAGDRTLSGEVARAVDLYLRMHEPRSMRFSRLPRTCAIGRSS